MSKSRILILATLLAALNLAYAQEPPTETHPDNPKATVREYGDFLIDMGLMGANPIQLPRFDFGLYPTRPDNLEQIFRTDTDATYSTQSLSTYTPLGFFTGTTEQWQSVSLKLKNGMRLNTYGQYNADGYKVNDPAALPWERNNFRGAFELKSANGAFGIKVEVRKGNSPYPPF